MITALLIPPSSAPHTTQVVADDAEGYQSIVGGPIEAVYGETAVGDRVVFYAHADSIQAGLPVNLVGTALWKRLNPQTGRNVLRGTVIVVGGDGPSDQDVPVLVSRMARTLHRQQLSRG